VLVFIEAEKLNPIKTLVPLSVAIFLLRFSPQKGFPLQSGLDWRLLFFAGIYAKVRFINEDVTQQ